MTPSAYGDSPQEVLGRVVIAAAWLAFYVWGWQSITHFSGLVSNARALAALGRATGSRS